MAASAAVERLEQLRRNLSPPRRFHVGGLARVCHGAAHAHLRAVPPTHFGLIGLWTTCGRAVDDLWTTCGRAVDALWTRPVPSLWQCARAMRIARPPRITVPASPAQYATVDAPQTFRIGLWTTCGRAVDALWTPSGHPLDTLWTTCGRGQFLRFGNAYVPRGMPYHPISTVPRPDPVRFVLSATPSCRPPRPRPIRHAAIQFATPSSCPPRVVLSVTPLSRSPRFVPSATPRPIRQTSVPAATP